MSALTSRVDDIDVQIEKIQRLIEAGSRVDPELAAGLGCAESLTNVQKKIDQAAAGAESLDRHLRDVRRSRQR
jgi:hypothetical protein